MVSSFKELLDVVTSSLMEFAKPRAPLLASEGLLWVSDTTPLYSFHKVSIQMETLGHLSHRYLTLVEEIASLCKLQLL
jgi:hypothetical protein